MSTSVEDIIQHMAYDPAARRERYLANRKLKGRKSGSGDAENRNDGGSASVPKTKANQAASQTRQVAALQGRLSSLREQLQKLLAEAGTSSSSSDSSTSEKKGGSNAGDKPLTAKEKADARVASEKYREKNPDKTTSDKDKPTGPTKEEQIARIRSVIQDVQAKLRTAIENARTQTASNGR